MVGEYQITPSQRSFRSGLLRHPRHIANDSSDSLIVRRTRPISLVRKAFRRSTWTPFSISSAHGRAISVNGTSTVTACPWRTSSCARSRNCTAPDVRSGR